MNDLPDKLTTLLATLQLAENDLISFIGLSLLAGVHILCGKNSWWRFFEAHGWISFSAGASVAYVFIHIFPELNILQQNLNGITSHHYNGQFFNHPLYLTALAGLCLPYLLDTLEISYAGNESRHHHKIHHSIFVKKTLVYIFYNAMLAYIIIRRPGEGLMNMKLIVVALSMHFIVINANFKDNYNALFIKYIRWFAVLGLISGAILGKTMDLPHYILAYLFALIGGIITYIALKEELPKTNHRAPFHFLSGVVCYALLALAIPYVGHMH